MVQAERWLGTWQKLLENPIFIFSFIELLYDIEKILTDCNGQLARAGKN